VLSARTGAPVERFEMRVLARRSRGHSWYRWQAEQGADPVVVPIPGPGMADAVLQIYFEADDHIDSTGYPVVPNPGQVTDLGVVYLEPGAVVSGRLFDAVGARPIAGCLPELAPAGPAVIQQALRGRQHVALSAEEGAFLFGGLTEGRYYLRTDCRTGPPNLRLVALDHSEQADLGEIWLPASRPVRVRVRGAGEGALHVMDRFREVREPLAVTALPEPDESAVGEGEASSFADFRLAPGRYRVDLKDGADSLLVSKEIEVEATGTGDRVEVELEYRPRTIRSVLTLGGIPVNRGFLQFERIPGSRASAGVFQLNSGQGGAARSTLFRPGSSGIYSTEVGEDGSFVLEGVPDEFLWMTWFSDEDRSRIGRIWPTGSLPQLDLGGTTVVAGEVRPAAGGELERIAVFLRGDLDLDVAGTETAANGSFVLPAVPPGRYLLVANAGAALVKEELVLTGDAPPPYQVLQADERWLGELEVRLATLDAPLAGAWIHILGSDELVAGAGIAFADGTYRSDRVSAGEATVVWNHGGACVGGAALEVGAGERVRFERTLRLGRLVELRCSERACAGKPLSLLRLETEDGVKVAHHLSGGLPGTTFSDDGQVGIGCLTPGAWTVSFWTADRRWEAEFELDPGDEEVPVTVTARPSPG